MHQNRPQQRRTGKPNQDLSSSPDEETSVYFKVAFQFNETWTLKSTQKYNTRTMSTFLVKATGYKTLTSSKPRAIHRVGWWVERRQTRAPRAVRAYTVLACGEALMLRTHSAELHEVEESKKQTHNTKSEWEWKRSPCNTESKPTAGAFNPPRSRPRSDPNLLHNAARSHAGLSTSPASSSQKAAVACFMQSDGSPSSLGWCRLSPKNIKRSEAGGRDRT